MNNNVFLSSNRNNDSQISSSEQNNDKYNPDVVRNYAIVKNLHNKSHDGKFINIYYKSVTNEPVKTNISSVKELQLEKDTPDIRTLTTNYDKSLQQRMAERMIVEQSIQRYKRENCIVEKTHEEINREYQIEQEKRKREKEEKEREKEREEKEEKEKKEEKEEKEREKEINLIRLNNFIIDDDEDKNKNDHITLKNQYKSYILNDNDKLLKEKKKYNDILKDLEDIL